MHHQPLESTPQEPRAARVIGAVFFVAALTCGIWLRVQVWPPGPSSDETSILQSFSDFGVRGIVDSPEAATNPPLFRLAFSLLGDPVRMYRWGRAFNAVCGLLAPLVVFFTARRAAGRDTLAGAIAAAVVVLNPTLAVESLCYRVYGLLALVAAVRLYCLCVLAEVPRFDGGRPAWVLFLLLTILLPWLHYSALPVLCLEAVALALLLPGHRRLLAAHGASGLLAIPAVLLLLKWRAILPPPPPSGNLLADALPLWGAGYAGVGVWTVATLLALVLLGCRGDAPRRAVFSHWLAWVGAALAIASYRAIRQGSLSMTVVPLGLTLGLVGATFAGSRRYVCHAGVLLAFLWWLPGSFRSDLLPIGYPNPGIASAVAFAADLQREPRPVRLLVYPAWNMGVLQFQLIARGEARGWRQCGDATPSTCNPDQTIQLFGVDDLNRPPHGSLVVLDCDSKPIGCRERGGYACAKVYECP